MSVPYGAIAPLVAMSAFAAVVGGQLVSTVRDTHGWVIFRGVVRGRSEQLVRVIGRALAHSSCRMSSPRRQRIARQGAAAAPSHHMAGRDPEVAGRHGASLGSRLAETPSADGRVMSSAGVQPLDAPADDHLIPYFDDLRGDDASC